MKATINFRIDVSLKEKLETFATEQRISVSDLVREIIQTYIIEEEDYKNSVQVGEPITIDISEFLNDESVSFNEI